MYLEVKNNSNFEIPLQTNAQYLYKYDAIRINWSDFNEQINPSAGGLPDKRIERKQQQLENFLFVFKTQIYPKYKAQHMIEKKYLLTLVDFCSGGGHLGILLAYMFPDCLVKLVENKEESLLVAIQRITKLELKNCFLYKVKFFFFQ